MDAASERHIVRKVVLRLIPFLFLLYLVNILDRVNVSFARLKMLDDLGMDEGAFAFGAGVFYLGYVLFEVPSNLILRRVGARRWIARIMVTWGLITCAMMIVTAPWGFYVLRVLLGFAEAGFFPGIILYLTYWFTSRERAWAVSCFMAASPINGILGGPLSGAIMQFMHEVGGLSGWQWLFLLEGIPAVILGIVTLRYLTDRPELADWLTADERTWLVARTALEETHRQGRRGLTLLNAFTDRRVWLLIALYFTIAIGANAFGFYLPKLIKDKFPGQREFQIGLLAAIPNLCAAVCMILNGTHSDRTGERRWHIALPAFLAAIGWTLTAWLDDPALYLAALALVQMGIMSMLPVFWTLPPAFLGGVAAAGGIALINSIGNLGGFVGPNIIGQLQRISGDFTSGVIALACILTLGGVLALCVRRESVKRTNS